MRVAIAVCLGLWSGCDRVFDLIGDENVDASVDDGGLIDGLPDGCVPAWGDPTTLGIAMATDPTIRSDLKEVYFARQSSSTGYDIYRTTRDAATGPFTPPVAVTFNSAGDDVDPQMLGDGLHLLFSSSRLAPTRVYEIARSSTTALWSVPRAVTPASVPISLGFAVTADGLTLITTSGDAAESIQMLTRPAIGDQFADPVPIGQGFRFPSLSANALTLFAHTPQYEMYETSRGSLTEPFSTASTTLIAPDASDPFITRDGSTLIYQDRMNGLTLLRRICVDQ